VLTCCVYLGAVLLLLQGHLLPPFPDALPDSSGEPKAQQQRSNTASGSGGSAVAAADAGAGAGQCAWREAEPRGDRQLAQQEQRKAETSSGGGSSDGSSDDAAGDGSSDDDTAAEGDERWQQHVAQQVADKCRHLCHPDQQLPLRAATAALRRALPLLPLQPGMPALLRQRRCTACREVTRAVHQAALDKLQLAAALAAAKEQAAEGKVVLTDKPAVSASGLHVNRQFLCVLEVSLPARLLRPACPARPAVLCPGCWPCSLSEEQEHSTARC
jgi:hypothetical protein